MRQAIAIVLMLAFALMTDGIVTTLGFPAWAAIAAGVVIVAALLEFWPGRSR